MATKKTWMQRTAEYRKAAVLDILHRPWSESESRAIKRIAAKYNGRTLPGGKHLHLSAGTLKRVWHNWKRDPSEKAFNMGYPEGQRDPMPAWVVKLLEVYALQYGCTLHELHMSLKEFDPSFPWSKDGFYRHLPEDTKQHISKATQIRKRQNALDREKEKLTTRGMNNE